MTIEVGDPVRANDGHSLDWQISSVEQGATTFTRYGLLRWDDIVRSRFPRSNLRRLIEIPSLWWHLWRSGYLKAFRREAWQFSTVLLVVHLMYAALVGASIVMAWLLLSTIPAGEHSSLLRFGLLGPAAYAVLGGLTRATKGRSFFITHLIDDTAFTHGHAAGADRDMRQRLDIWADWTVSAEGSASEIVVVGHSSSSFLALEVLDRVPVRNPDFGRNGTPVTLVTLGGVIAWLALDPRAVTMCSAIKRIAETDRIGWLDLRAPWDWLSIHARSPLGLIDQGEPRPDRPVIRSVAIEDLIEPCTVFFPALELLPHAFPASDVEPGPAGLRLHRADRRVSTGSSSRRSVARNGRIRGRGAGEGRGSAVRDTGMTLESGGSGFAVKAPPI